MWFWLAQNPIPVQAIAAVVQALVAIAIFVATCFYVRWTRRLAETTNDLVKATQNQVSLTANIIKASENQIKLQERLLLATHYERYVRVLQVVMEFLANFGTSKTITARDYEELCRGTREAKFLFSDDVNTFISKLREGAVEYRLKSVDGRNSGHDPSMAEFERWVTEDAFNEAERVFARYLRPGDQDADVMSAV